MEAAERRLKLSEPIGKMISALAEAIEPRYRALVLFDAYCGLRLGELAGLRRSRVDLLRRHVQVTEIAVEVRGQLLFGPPKTRAGQRKVPLPRFVADEMAVHLDTYGDADPDWSSSGPMGALSGPTGGGPGTGGRRSGRPGSSRFGRTTFGTLRSHSGSQPGRAQSRSPPGRDIRPSPSSSTGTDTSSLGTSRRCSIASTPSPLPRQ